MHSRQLILLGLFFFSKAVLAQPIGPHKLDTCSNEDLKAAAKASSRADEEHWIFECSVPALDNQVCGLKKGDKTTPPKQRYTIPSNHSLSIFVKTVVRTDKKDPGSQHCPSFMLYKDNPPKPTKEATQGVCAGQTVPTLIWENGSTEAVEVYLIVDSAYLSDWKFSGEYIIAPVPPKTVPSK